MHNIHKLAGSRILSGVQPTGVPTLGNYFGAFTQFKSFQGIGSEHKPVLFMIADLHSFSVAANAPSRDEIKENIYTTVASFIACGIDLSPANPNAFLFKQSDIPSHTQMKWFLECVSPLGELYRMTQFKSKESKESTSLGLLSYPVLMAADILLYKADAVPVGEDQLQHLELIRSIAFKFNKLVKSEVLVPPRAVAPGDEYIPKVMSLLEPNKKMSKSSPNKKATILLTDSSDAIMKKIKGSLTDSYPCIDDNVLVNEDRKGVLNLITLYHTLSNSTDPIEQTVKSLHGLTMSQFKPMLIECLVERICPIGKSIEELLQDKTYLKEIIEHGNERANVEASATIETCKALLGLKL